jgi:hypothetical protein
VPIYRTLFRLVAAACLSTVLGLLHGPDASAQTPVRQSNHVLVPPFQQPRPDQNRNANHAPQDPAALLLLRKMLRPTADYAGEQMTEVMTLGGLTSRQTIKGDTHGRIRRDFLAPEKIAGDVMLIAPGQFHYYHRRDNVHDIALWPMGRNEREKRMFELVRQGRASVAQVGTEMIAGRNAAIIAVSRDATPGAMGPQVKFWIDTETGIQLKIELSNARGLLSRTYVTSLVVGPEASVHPKDFEVNFPTARQNPLFPKTQFHTLEEARDRLPFTPLEPATLPPGYHLSGVWVFGGPNARQNRHGSVLLRYTDDVSNFSLFQRQMPDAPAAASPPNQKINRRSIQRWRLGDREITYIGHLTPEQVQAVYDSLR